MTINKYEFFFCLNDLDRQHKKKIRNTILSGLFIYLT